MARQPMVTRTIPTTIADILVINVDTGISEEREVSIPREYKKVKKLREKARLPLKGSESAAGADLYACPDEPVMIPPGKTAFIPWILPSMLLSEVGFR